MSWWNPVDDIESAYNDVKGAGSWLWNKAGAVKNALEGNPQGAANNLAQLQQQAYAQGNAIKNFLMGQKASSEAYYQPMQRMFGNMYGTGGMMPATVPGVPGSRPLPGGK